MTPPSADLLHDRIRAASCNAEPGQGDQAALLRAEIERFGARVEAMANRHAEPDNMGGELASRLMALDLPGLVSRERVPRRRWRLSVYNVAKVLPAPLFWLWKRFVIRWCQCAFASLEYVPSSCPECGKKSQNDDVRCQSQPDESGEYYCAMSDAECRGREYWFPYDEDSDDDAPVLRATRETWRWADKAESFYWAIRAAEVDRKMRPARRAAPGYAEAKPRLRQGESANACPRSCAEPTERSEGGQAQ